MALLNCEEVIGEYLSQLNTDFDAFTTDGDCLLSTPFVRPDGEGIELMLQEMPNGHIGVSDMGNTLGYLYVNGLTLSKALMTDARTISKTHGVSLQRNQLRMEVESGSLGTGIHGLIQAALGVSNLIYKRRPTSRVLFDDEVESFIIQSGVAYDVGFKVRGQREEHTIKFHVNSGRNLLVQPLSAAAESVARSWAERLAYRFADIRDSGTNWHPLAVLDDRNARADVWNSYSLTPIKEYAIKWSQQDELASMLNVTNRS